MTRQDYIVKYVAFGSDNRILKHGTMRCKNKLSNFDAMAGLENHFKAKLPGFAKLTVTSVEIATAETFLDLLLNLYKK